MSKLKGDDGYPANWCIHYSYNLDVRPGEPDTCEAGVDYATVRGPNQPCFLNDQGQSRPGARKCAHLRRPTAEEIATHEAWHEKHMEMMAVVMTGIRGWRRAHQRQNFAEVVECPACKGRLHLSIAAYNGHVHGRCETDGCVSWME